VSSSQKGVQRRYLFTFTGKVYTYRAVVDQGYIHHGLEYAILDLVLHIQLLYLIEESRVQFFRLTWASRLVEIGLVALFGGCEKRKLRDWTRLAPGFASYGVSRDKPQRTSPPTS